MQDGRLMGRPSSFHLTRWRVFNDRATPITRTQSCGRSAVTGQHSPRSRTTQAAQPYAAVLQHLLPTPQLHLSLPGQGGLKMHPAIDEQRLTSITHLYQGSHNLGDNQMCIMEAVAFVTHKDWTDHPQCVCPMIGAFMRSWNDALPNDERTALLLPFIPHLINTRGSDALVQRRATMAA